MYLLENFTLQLFLLAIICTLLTAGNAEEYLKAFSADFLQGVLKIKGKMLQGSLQDSVDSPAGQTATTTCEPMMETITVRKTAAIPGKIEPPTTSESITVVKPTVESTTECEATTAMSETTTTSTPTTMSASTTTSESTTTPGSTQSTECEPEEGTTTTKTTNAQWTTARTAAQTTHSPMMTMKVPTKLSSSTNSLIRAIRSSNHNLAEEPHKMLTLVHYRDESTWRRYFLGALKTSPDIKRWLRELDYGLLNSNDEMCSTTPFCLPPIPTCAPTTTTCRPTTPTCPPKMPNPFREFSKILHPKQKSQKKPACGEEKQAGKCKRRTKNGRKRKSKKKRKLRHRHKTVKVPKHPLITGNTISSGLPSYEASLAAKTPQQLAKPPIVENKSVVGVQTAARVKSVVDCPPAAMQQGKRTAMKQQRDLHGPSMEDSIYEL